MIEEDINVLRFTNSEWQRFLRTGERPEEKPSPNLVSYYWLDPALTYFVRQKQLHLVRERGYDNGDPIMNYHTPGVQLCGNGNKRLDR